MTDGEAVLREPEQQAGLADRRITNDDQLKQVVVPTALR